ncbi:hypothetical protein IAE22_35905, partial [Bacillus sp. S34]|nr:hypothetical protein [Bacillus sp. S34]
METLPDADRLEVQVAYAIGRAAPVGLYVVDMTGTHLPTAIDASGKPETGAV